MDFTEIWNVDSLNGLLFVPEINTIAAGQKKIAKTGKGTIPEDFY